MELGYKKEINLKPDEAELLNKHLQNKSNPHKITKGQIGLSDVDNTSDLDKPLSNAMKEALGERLSFSFVMGDVDDCYMVGSSHLYYVFPLDVGTKEESHYMLSITEKHPIFIVSFPYEEHDYSLKVTQYKFVTSGIKIRTGVLNYKEYNGEHTLISKEWHEWKSVEMTRNKVAVIDENSTDEQYPSAKAVWDKFNEKIIDKNVSSSDNFDEFTADYFNLTSGGSVILKGYIEDEYNSYILFVQAGHEDVLSTHQTLLITNCYDRSTSLVTRIYDSNKWTSWDNYLKKSTVMKSLTYDDMPTEGSNNLLTSGTIHKLNETKVDKYYKPLFPTLTITEEDILNAGEGGITQLVVGDDNSSILETINELYIYMYVPKSTDLNTANSCLRIALSTSTSKAIVQDNSIFWGQTPAYAPLESQHNTNYVIKSVFAEDKTLMYSEYMRNGYSATGYPQNALAVVYATNNGRTLTGSKAIIIRGNNFKFPKGTTVTVYGK